MVKRVIPSRLRRRQFGYGPAKTGPLGLVHQQHRPAVHGAVEMRLADAALAVVAVRHQAALGDGLPNRCVHGAPPSARLRQYRSARPGRPSDGPPGRDTPAGARARRQILYFVSVSSGTGLTGQAYALRSTLRSDSNERLDGGGADAYADSLVARRDAVVALVPGLALAAPAPPPDAPDADQAPGLDRGVFATVCQFSHEASDDPIVYPGQAGKSHLHDFFGNATTDAASTYDSLRAGANTCRTAEDSSGYWVPALYRNGAEVKPSHHEGVLSDRAPRSGVRPGVPARLPDDRRDSTATSAQALRTTFWLCQRQHRSDRPAGRRPVRDAAQPAPRAIR